MAITTKKVRFFWGALDYEEESVSGPYPSTAYKSLGPSAVETGGIGVRRATLLMDRSTAVPADDDATMHFDFLNITSGEPDDTWIAADYTTVEALLTTWFNGVKNQIPAWHRLYRIMWHRVGTGVSPPNPATRILDVTPVPATGSAFLIPQAASTISFRTAARKQWGRTYVPVGAVGGTSSGRLTPSVVDALVSNTVTLFNGAYSADFHPVVTSLVHAGAFGIESVAADDTVDIIRRRRWKHTVYRKQTAL